MNRPLIEHRLPELKQMRSDDNSVENQNAILYELGFRTSRGAKRLFADIQSSLESITSSTANGIPANDNNQPISLDQIVVEVKPYSGSYTQNSSNQQLTPEQNNAIALFQSGDNLNITAFAGTGKTSTLVSMARSSSKRGIYLAFNKAIAEDAEFDFPEHVECRTIHSLAFKAIEKQYSFKFKKMTGRIGPNKLAKELNLRDLCINNSISLTTIQQAQLLLTTIKNYCQSEDDEIGDKHVHLYGRFANASQTDYTEISIWLVASAKSLWKMMCDPSNLIPLGHDGYLKLWANCNPKFEHDYILLDEAQDTNPVMVRVLKNQSCQLIFVGDKHQQIYSWRGAVDAFDRFNLKNQCYLTKSFRFGEDLAHEASLLLQQLGEQKPLLGTSEIVTELQTEGAADAILTRTNASVIEHALKAISNGLKPFIIGGKSETMQLVSAVYDLKKGKSAKHPDYFGFSNWDDVVNFSESEEGSNVRSFVKLVQKHGERKLYLALKSSEDDEYDADVIISTAHKAKGKEWDSVQISDDFEGVRKGGNEISDEETRLFYVAITRAKDLLIVSPTLLKSYQSGTFH